MPHAVSWLYAKYKNFTCAVPQSRPVNVMDESSLSCSEEAGGWKHALKTKVATSFEISVNFYKNTWCHTLQAMPTGEVGGGGAGGTGTNYRGMAVRNRAMVPNGLHVFWFLAGPGLAGGDQKNLFTKARTRSRRPCLQVSIY